MALYFISYDLIIKKDYPKLTAELERLGARRVLLSDWSLEHANTTAADILNHLEAFLDEDDRLVVTRISDWATRSAISLPPNV